MRTVLPLIGTASMLVVACSHAQTPEVQASGTSTSALVAQAPQQEAKARPVEAGQQAPASLLSNGAAVESTASGPSPGDSLAQLRALSPSPEAVAATEEGVVSEGDPIRRFLLTHGIEEREPVDVDDTFRPGERIYAFLDVANPDGEQYAVSLRWEYADGKVGKPTELTIGSSPHFRTWALWRAPAQPGAYRCIVESEDGQALAELPFSVDHI